MTKIVKIACLQTRPMADFTSALTEALELAERAVTGGAKMLFLPEYCGGLRTEGSAFAPPTTIEDKHPVLQGLCKFADANSVWIMIGSIAVPGTDGMIINRGFIIDDTGTIQSRYDKIHMFDIQLSSGEIYRESARVTPGNSMTLTDTPIGIVGHTICYDIRFPHLYRDLSLAGAEILAVPAAFTKKTGEAHWHVLNRARAIENGAYVISACAYGKVEGGGESYGHSLIIDPWGEVLADAGDGAGVIFAEIDPAKSYEARQKIPNLSGAREYSLPTQQMAAE